MKIAIVKLSAMGDIVHAMVALQLIKAQRPDVLIDWVVEQSLVGILADNPDINQILTVNLKALKQNKRQVFSQLRQLRLYAVNHYDYVIDAQGLLKSAIVAKLLGRHTIGFSKNSIREKFAANLYSQTVDIDFDAGIVYVNGQPIDEPYIADATHVRLDFDGMLTVPENHVFVMGDNRNGSTDSRDSTIGCVDNRYVLGKVILRLFPISDFEAIKNPNTEPI